MEKESWFSKILEIINSRSIRSLLYIAIFLLAGKEVLQFGNKYFELTLSKNEISINNNVINMNEGRAIVSRQFLDASQACWFYHDNYRNLHPYTLIWEKEEEPGEEKEPDSYPKLRVVAEPATWKAKMCSKDGLEMHLSGDEEVTHTIDAQFEKGGDFVRIAKSTATYHSVLIFDNSGRIVGRKLVVDEYKCSFLYPNKIQNKNFKLDKEVCETSMSSLKKKDKQEPEKRINSLVITPDEKIFKNEANYDVALNRYIAERMRVHRKLVVDGCGVITIEPILEEKNKAKIKPAIVFLCFKDDVGSHVRVMVREE